MSSHLENEDDRQASLRKEDHIDLAFKSGINVHRLDTRFYYEPVLSAHPRADDQMETVFLGKTLAFPVWVSSMTGGTEKAERINKNLASCCAEFKLGMGLGSCRQLLYTDRRFDEFHVRPYLEGQPLAINLGIAQVEQLLADMEVERIDRLMEKLEADALIIHVNPLQEWLQPEGDRIKAPPLETIQRVLALVDYPVIVKEVGQGFGKHSLKSLLSLPLAAIELAGNGGTNFSKLELLRSSEDENNAFMSLSFIGHSAPEMIDFCNTILENDPSNIKCDRIIASGGIKDFLDGFYCIKKSRIPALYAQASGFLKYATGQYSTLKDHVERQIRGLQIAQALLRIKE